MTAARVADAGLQRYRALLHGELLQPGDEGYKSCRQVWNARIDRHPPLIARCADASDVITTVRFAREHDLLVSVRGGGHNVGGKAVHDGALMIDLSSMKGVCVDPVRRTVRADAGLTWRELDCETHKHGLATPGGTAPHTGIAGVTLGGGIGWLSREYGLSCDNLTSVEIVTAGGRLLTASADVNPDLFWAVRGAGPNFGIVTSFEYRLHPVTSFVAGQLVYPTEQARDVFRFFAEYSRQLPDQMSTLAGLVTSPAGDQPFIIVVSYHGDERGAERWLRPLRRVAPPVVDSVTTRSYLGVQCLLEDPTPRRLRAFWHSHFFAAISDDAIDAMIAGFRTVPSRKTAVTFQQTGGAVKRVPPSATAFCHRSAEYDFTATSCWGNEASDQENIEWTEALGTTMQRFSTGGVYVNNLGDETPDRVRTAYGSNYTRLAALKRAYDPANFFRLNQNIAPTV
jgi:FAD/FMN-containing dehydrogenase